MAVRRVLWWSLQGPGSHALPPFDGLAGDGQPRGSLPRPGDLASLGMCICSMSGSNCCAGKELSVPMVCAKRTSGVGMGVGGQRELASLADEEMSLELSVFLCFSLQRAPLVASLSPAVPQALCSSTTLSLKGPLGGCRRLPSGALASQGACSRPSSLAEGGWPGWSLGAAHR